MPRLHGPHFFGNEQSKASKATYAPLLQIVRSSWTSQLRCEILRQKAVTERWQPAASTPDCALPVRFADAPDPLPAPRGGGRA